MISFKEVDQHVLLLLWQHKIPMAASGLRLS
jgi:hypothetical protein